jgi:hypothetical protein
MNKNDRKQADAAMGVVSTVASELDTIKSELEVIAQEARESASSDTLLDPDDVVLLGEQRNMAALVLVKRATGLWGALEEAENTLESLSEAEQEKYDNLNEGLQASERGMAFESNAGNLSEAASEIGEVESTLSDIDVADDVTLDAAKLDDIAEQIGEAVSTLENISFDAE